MKYFCVNKYLVPTLNIYIIILVQKDRPRRKILTAFSIQLGYSMKYWIEAIIKGRRTNSPTFIT